MLLVGLYIMSTNWAIVLAKPVADFSRTLGRGFWSNAIFQFAEYIKTLLQPAPSLLAIAIFVMSVILLMGLKGRNIRVILGHSWIKCPLCSIIYRNSFCTRRWSLYHYGSLYRPQFTRICTGWVLHHCNRSTHPSKKRLTASGQMQQYTFRKVTLPLILPALLAGLIFSFTRHMTSLSAIIFLVNAKWRIVTASILSEWEQGGVSIAAAYSTVIIILVMLAIGVLNIVTRRMFRGRDGIDLSQGM